MTPMMTASTGDREYRFAPELRCRSILEIVDSSEVNAWADGTRVVLTNAMLERCDREADLAFVIAHEMAHNILHHRARLELVRHPLSGRLPTAAVISAAVRETEEEADREAIILATAAGYDVSNVGAFLHGLLNPLKGPRLAAATHPDSARRLLLLRAAIAGATRGVVL